METKNGALIIKDLLSDIGTVIQDTIKKLTFSKIYYPVAIALSVASPIMGVPFLLAPKITYDILPKKYDIADFIGVTLITTTLTLGVMAQTIDAYLADKWDIKYIKTDIPYVFEGQAFPHDSKQLFPFFVDRQSNGKYLIETEDARIFFDQYPLRYEDPGHRLIINQPTSVKLSKHKWDELYQKNNVVSDFDVWRVELDVLDNTNDILADYLKSSDQ